ncbi:BTB/POZ domain-containing protein [Thalictrum thalictroides]|uniref:BTB/POZ domain-containing protein n=1 Tax=Thalictrum thalictroides TaxID=46969 RepID=A0A7J6VDF7_THATH|nr:BTB/POZ domain-containing protein [Thalictrum thalictroides]
MKELSDHIKVHINGEHTFCLNQRIMSRYSGKLKKTIKQQNNNIRVEIHEFPGGVDGFELISRFCYNNGKIQITPSNISILYCSAIFLEMSEKLSPCNLIQKTETFLQGLFYWSWTDILIALKSCEYFFSCADSSGLLDKLIPTLLSKISLNSDFNLITPSSSPSSSSPSPEIVGINVKSSSPTKAWWFDDLTILSPKIIEKVIKTMGCYGNNNNSLILTKFLIHYLKRASSKMRGGNGLKSKWCAEYAGLTDTAVHGVVLMGKTGFSCRGLFWVLRVVSALGLSAECRSELEKLIGGVLEKATLDDLLVSGHSGVGVYDVNFVLRLVRVFVDGDAVAMQRMKKVGRLIDKYMAEISPDHNLKISKFLAVAESLPDNARDSFDGVYRAIDIYVESHPTLSFEERSVLCRCLNYEKLSLEACKDLAKSPRIPPRIAVQALISQQSKVQGEAPLSESSCSPFATQFTSSPGALDSDTLSEYSEAKEEMKVNLQRMQWRVMELEKVCIDMKNQMSKMVKNKSISTTANNRAMPRLC